MTTPDGVSIDVTPRLAAALASGQDAAAWERFWLDLLAEYEAVCAELATEEPR